jgi:putative oxidoreductase
MIKTLYGEFAKGRAAWGLLAVRLVFGVGLSLHGLQKIGNPFGWMGEGAPVPGFFQFLAFLSEFGGGLALLFGFASPLAALGVAFTMFVAMATAHAAHPFVGTPGEPSKELAATYFAFALLMLFNGPGKLSIDGLLFGREKVQEAKSSKASVANATRASA